MQKSVRSFALVAVLALAVAPAVRAEQGGCIPHPQPPPPTPATVTALQVIAYTIISYFGL
jgi:hypothetical protein